MAKPKKPMEYVVWKRSDGHIGVSVSMPTGWPVMENGKLVRNVTFELLKTFDKWGPEIIEYIGQQRKLSGI